MNPRKIKQKALRKRTKQLHPIHYVEVCTTIRLKILTRYVSISVERIHCVMLVDKVIKHYNHCENIYLKFKPLQNNDIIYGHTHV